MRRYLKLLRIFTTNSLQLELEYRGNFVLNVFNSLITTATGLLVLYAMFANAESVGGWSFGEALTLYGVFMVFEALIDIFMYPNLNKLPEYIRVGNLDFFLLKPISAQFMVSARFLRVWMLPQLLLALGIIGYGMAQAGQLARGHHRAAGDWACSFAARTIVYAIWFMLTTTAFWLVKVANISELFYAFFTAGRFPVSAFPAWARFFLTFVVPIAFITTVPAAAAVGRLTPGAVLGSVIMAGALFGLSRLLWHYAVANYTSASS